MKTYKVRPMDNFEQNFAVRRRRAIFAFFAVPLLLGASIFIYFNIMPPDNTIRNIGGIAMIVCLVLAGAGLLLTYLQTGFSQTIVSRQQSYAQYETELNTIKNRLRQFDLIDDDRLKEVRESLENVREEIQTLRSSKSQLSEMESEHLFEVLRTRFAQEESQRIIATIESSIREQVGRDVRVKSASAQSEIIVQRLSSEIAALSRRGNLNLVLGILTTITGLGVLAYYVFHTQVAANDPWLFTCQFVPRLTLVLFIEIFAYFFLRLYKASLSEIKYFQNELTNIESQFAGLLAAITSNYDDATKEAIATLTRTERNAVLKKGETTVDIEKARIDRESIAEIVKGVAAAVKGK